MKKLTVIFTIMLAVIYTYAQKKPAYVLYNSKGKKVSYNSMIKSFQRKDMALFGEEHNNPIAHWLQLELVKDLNKTKKLILGAEMFETDNQKPLSDYLAGKITARGLDSLARLWKNYKTDYAPLVNFAKTNNVRFIATNIPRKYANLVYKNGFEALDTLPAEVKSWIAPLPIAYDPQLPGYVKMKNMMPGHGGDNLPKAQAVKDATMSHFILKNWEAGKFLIHFNGAYHTDNYEGILWYLKKARPDLKYATISTVAQSDCSKLLDENIGKADFIICVDEDMTTTY